MRNGKAKEKRGRNSFFGQPYKRRRSSHIAPFGSRFLGKKRKKKITRRSHHDGSHSPQLKDFVQEFSLLSEKRKRKQVKAGGKREATNFP